MLLTTTIWGIVYVTLTYETDLDNLVPAIMVPILFVLYLIEIGFYQWYQVKVTDYTHDQIFEDGQYGKYSNF